MLLIFVPRALRATNNARLKLTQRLTRPMARMFRMPRVKLIIPILPLMAA